MHRLRRTPLVAVALTAATACAFALASAGESRLAVRCQAVEYGLIPYELTHPGAQLTDPWCQPQPGADEHAAHEHPRGDPGLTADAPAWVTPLTAPFVHGGLAALLVTLVFLWPLGSALERRLGSLGLLGVFTAGALGSAATLVALSPALPIVTVGGSGAVAGLLGACAVACRRARLSSLELPLWVVAAAFAVAQVLLARADAAQPVAGAGGDVAYLAPLGGLAAGALLARVLQPSRAKAASKTTPECAKSVRRTNAGASWAPYPRSIPESSHSIESGPRSTRG